MRFFNRQQELGRLGGLLQRPDGALAVLWGRRRIGKSRLLLEWCRRSGGLYTVADTRSISASMTAVAPIGAKMSLVVRR